MTTMSNRFAIDRAVAVKCNNLTERERHVHEAMLEAPVDEAPIFFAAMRRLNAEKRHFLRMSARPSTADLVALDLAN